MFSLYKRAIKRDSSWDDEHIYPLNETTAIPLLKDMLNSEYLVTNWNFSDFYYMRTGFFSDASSNGNQFSNRLAAVKGICAYLKTKGIDCNITPNFEVLTTMAEYPWSSAKLHFKDISVNQLITKLNAIYTHNELNMNETTHININTNTRKKSDTCCNVL